MRRIKLKCPYILHKDICLKVKLENSIKYKDILGAIRIARTDWRLVIQYKDKLSSFSQN